MVPGGIPRFLGSTAAAVAERHALPVEVQGFALPVWREVSDTPSQNKSSQWLTSCARQPYQRSNRLSSSPGGAQTRQTEINYAVARVRFHSSKRLAASIAC